MREIQNLGVYLAPVAFYLIGWISWPLEVFQRHRRDLSWISVFLVHLLVYLCGFIGVLGCPVPITYYPVFFFFIYTIIILLLYIIIRREEKRETLSDWNGTVAIHPFLEVVSLMV